ncbi:CD40 ligand [Labrus bergylta]|uniref:CD40 ligand n=1 Tax=Labrus bergylta TaxID=56723 RepID=A0A3Q3F0N8_9LABR|nr:CD40 ligand [Labrus bergylta]
MINTYQTSLAPPPIPPRHNGSHSVFIPAPAPSKGHSKVLLQFVLGVVLLQLFLSIVGFIFLSSNVKKEHFSSAEVNPKMSLLLSEQKKGPSSERTDKALASMVVSQKARTQTSTAGYLQWDEKHSDLRNISLFSPTQLAIQKSGKYYVYSKVTFSKGDPGRPLTSWIMLRKSMTDKDEVAMKAYCNLDSHRGSVPNLCTATQGGVVTLESGNQLSVWVQDCSLVDYEEGATAFGMYEL